MYFFPDLLKVGENLNAICMKKSLILLLVLVVLFACKQNNRFSVSGTVKDANGQMLYLEHSGLLKTTVLDSAKLGEDGGFSFKSDRPAYPDFYRLRMSDKVITFAVDSCEDIIFAARDKNFATDYTVTGSPSSVQILKLRKSLMLIQQKANELSADMGAEVKAAKITSIKNDIRVHKDMAKNLILANPRSTAAYFALYQKLNDSYLFSPYVKEDAPFCKAVATSYNTYMPEYERTKNLYSLVIDAIRTERSAKAKEEWDNVLEKVGKGYIDIDLKDSKNVAHKLSGLEGKLVLIDFSAYDADGSVDYTFALRDLYNKYHSRGFEIYQVSLDQNKQAWEQAVQNIPWTCVRDEAGPNARIVSTYNISTIPTTFLLSRKGTIVSRSPSFEELDRLIKDNL
jgi:peroxiredoxin